MLEQILDDGLAALIPVYEGGNVTRVIASDGTQVIEPRTCRTVLKNIARIYGIDLVATRQRYRGPVNKKHQVPIPLGASLVLIPVKLRSKPLGANDGTLGYVNFRQILEVEDAETRACRITLRSGQAITALVSSATVREYMKNAGLVEKIYIDRHLPGYGSTGLTSGRVFEAEDTPSYGEKPSYPSTLDLHKENQALLRAYLLQLLLEILHGDRNQAIK